MSEKSEKKSRHFKMILKIKDTKTVFHPDLGPGGLFSQVVSYEITDEDHKSLRFGLELQSKMDSMIDGCVEVLMEELDELPDPNYEPPYLYEPDVKVIKKINPKYDMDKECKCGHPYHRHFDSYDDNYPVGCKYCSCHTFEANEGQFINFDTILQEDETYAETGDCLYCGEKKVVVNIHRHECKEDQRN